MNFASDLRRELSGWVRDGLVEQSQADSTQARYAGDESRGTTSLLLPTIYIVGAALIGGGAISFVAANWDSIPIPVRIGLLVSTMLACEIAGFVLCKVKGTRENLGQALVALGALVFGASVFLIAQMYHLRGEPHVAFGVWTLGALVLAYATFSSPTMLLVCVTSFVWSVGWLGIHPHDLFWYPVALCVACVPFLRRLDALAMTGLLIAGGAAVATAAGKDSGEEWPVLAALMALGALSRGVGLWLEQRESTLHMSVSALRLGGLVILLPAYMLSFHDGLGGEVSEELWVADGWLWVVLLALVYARAAASWFAALRRASRGGDVRMRIRLAMLAAALLVTVGIAAGHEVALVVAANLALLNRRRTDAGSVFPRRIAVIRCCAGGRRQGWGHRIRCREPTRIGLTPRTSGSQQGEWSVAGESGSIGGAASGRDGCAGIFSGFTRRPRTECPPRRTASSASR